MLEFLIRITLSLGKYDLCEIHDRELDLKN